MVKKAEYTTVRDGAHRYPTDIEKKTRGGVRRGELYN